MAYSSMKIDKVEALSNSTITLINNLALLFTE